MLVPARDDRPRCSPPSAWRSGGGHPRGEAGDAAAPGRSSFFIGDLFDDHHLLEEVITLGGDVDRSASSARWPGAQYLLRRTRCRCRSLDVVANLRGHSPASSRGVRPRRPEHKTIGKTLRSICFDDGVAIWLTMLISIIRLTCSWWRRHLHRRHCPVDRPPPALLAARPLACDAPRGEGLARGGGGGGRRRRAIGAGGAARRRRRLPPRRRRRFRRRRFGPRVACALHRPTLALHPPAPGTRGLDNWRMLGGEFEARFGDRVDAVVSYEMRAALRRR